MSEKIYAWLLRLYPAQFRCEYGEDALQLFRDRYRDEGGFFPRMRLWFDLLADLVSVPRNYDQAQPVIAGAAPAFHLLQTETPRPVALLFGMALTGVGLVAPSLLSNFAQPHNSAAEIWPDRLFQTSAPASDRRVLIDRIAANLTQYYFDNDVGRKMAVALQAHERLGEYSGVNDEELADLLTRQIRDISHDVHLEVVYSPEILPTQPPEPTAESQARYRKAMEQANCTFGKVQILANNIGYLKLDSFPDVSVCRATAVAAMASLNNADTIIFDLRENRGGYPNMVSLIAAYLFDHPEYMYNPRESPTVDSWTKSPVPGSRLAGKPVFILTSASTWSGAEQFSYDLKMLKRATLVGETTRGGAHAGVWRRIDDHFGMGIPEVKAINPFSNADWEGTGVGPDVKVKASDALQIAEKLAAPPPTIHWAKPLPGSPSAHK
jgi:hypothetical protein